MGNKARTTINIPADIDREITRIRRSLPQLSRNEVLLMLARRGVAETVVGDLGKLKDDLLRSLEGKLDGQTSGTNQDQGKDIYGETRKNKELNLQILILLRRFVREILPDKGQQLMDQAKADFESLRRKPGE